MEARNWLESDWGVSEKGRRARYYRISAEGRRALAREERQWARYVEAVAKITSCEAET
jgi:DNA-binding PadR family transcriptional regulator